MTREEKEHIVKIMDDCVSKLREHVDNVQILCNTVDDGNTIAWKSGYGNWYARMAQVQELVRENDERDRFEVRRSEDED